MQVRTVGALVSLAFALAVSAQTTRTVIGKVTGPGGVLLGKSVVYLENVSSIGSRSCVTAEDGSFRFIDLSTTDDYKIRARHNTQWSPTVSISHTAAEETIEVTLVIGPAAGGSSVALSHQK